MERFKFQPTHPGKKIKKSDAALRAEKIAQDPGLRKIFLNRAPDVYEDLWKKSGVDQEDMERYKDELLRTINDPNLQHKTAVKIISVIVKQQATNIS